MSMTDEDFEALSEFKKYFETCESGYAGYLSGPAVHRLKNIYDKLTGKDYQVSSYSCSSCILRLLRFTAPFYFGEVARRKALEEEKNNALQEANDEEVVEVPKKKAGRPRKA